MISRNFITWFLITIIIALGIYLVWWTKTQSFQCVSNPYGYTVKLLEEANEAPVECLCTAHKPGKTVTAKLTNTGFQAIVNVQLTGPQEQITQKLNISLS